MTDLYGLLFVPASLLAAWDVWRGWRDFIGVASLTELEERWKRAGVWTRTSALAAAAAAAPFPFFGGGLVWNTVAGVILACVVYVGLFIQRRRWYRYSAAMIKNRGA